MRMLSCLLLVAALGLPALAQDSEPPEKPPAKPPADTPKEEPKAEPKAETLDETLRRIEAAHKEHKDFAGKFEQTKFIPLTEDEVKSSGRFVFKKPDHVRWEYEKPSKSILVVAGDGGQKWSAATGRTEKFKLSEDRGMDAVVKQLFTWFKGEFTKLKDDYEVSVSSREPLKLTMKPKSEVLRKFINRIEVTFTKDDAEIDSVKLVEPLQPGDELEGYTLYVFKDTALDKGVKESEFEIGK